VSMYPIASYTSNSTFNVTFSSIPQNFTHLQLRIFCRVNNGSSTGNIYFNFNTDNGTNYASHELYGNGSSAYSTSSTSTAYPILAYQVAGTGATNNIYSTCIVDILDYTNTNKYKTIRQLTGNDQNGSGVVTLGSGLWQNTSAINGITLLPDGSAFAANSVVSLYGITTA